MKIEVTYRELVHLVELLEKDPSFEPRFQTRLKRLVDDYETSQSTGSPFNGTHPYMPRNEVWSHEER